MIATRSGNVEIIRRLLEAGADVDAADADGLTALNSATDAVDNIDVLTRLISAGAKVNTADNEGVTPLMRAAARGKPDFVAALIKAGADVNAKDRRGWTASQWANNRGDDFGREVIAAMRGPESAVPSPGAQTPAAAPAPAPATP
jgi:ankyrin repeat protein